MKEDLLFYDAYEEFYKMASTSETFRDFCIDAYGADFSQDGFSDVKQIDMIVPFIMNSDAHVLDIGCGNGKMIKYLGDKTGAHIHGFDYSDNAIMHATTNNDSGDFRVGVIGKIEYSKESFDVIVAMDSMYFAPDMASFVSQIRNWLKPGGVLFVAYQEGDVMDKTANEDTTDFAEAMRVIGWEYEVKDISEDSYDMLVNKRKVALAYKDRFEGEDNGTWGDMLIEQTDYVLQGKVDYDAGFRYVETVHAGRASYRNNEKLHNILKNKKVIFFDVGYTLDYPASGDWMFTKKFNEVLGDKLNGIDSDTVSKARDYALTYLENNHLVNGIEEEYKQFHRFYSDIVKYLGIEISAEDIDAIAKDRATNMNNYVVYEDALCVVKALSQTHKLGIISDTWPSIDNQLKAIGVYDYFSTFTYSCDLGVFKPNEIMYLDALQKCGCKPEETVFIDDSVRNFEGAETLGITPILIAANSVADVETKYYKIHSLSAFLIRIVAMI